MHQSATADIVAGLVGLLLVAAVTLAVTSRLRFPFSVALLLLGILLTQLAGVLPAALGPLHELEISADLILYVFLPTLVFESAFHLDWRALRQNLVPVLTLAVPGLLLSAAIIGWIVSTLTGIPFAAALLLGAILSATDPVAVIALFKRLGAPQRLTVLVEGESLFNDATSIVLARILVGIVAAGTISASEVGSGILDFTIVFFGGIVVGWLLGEATGWVLGKVQSDPAIEITLTTVLAYLSFLVAEEGLHVSGVMATVTAGLTFGNRGWMRVSASVRSYLEHFWEYMAFVATALIFLMVGLSADIGALPAQWDTLAVLIGAMLLSRFAVIYGLVPLVNRLPRMEHVSRGYQHVMYWGGLRGAIALAIVLSLPDDFPHKADFIVLVTGAVLFTLLVQGVTMDRLVRWLGLDQRPLADRYSEAESVLAGKRHALDRLPELSAGGLFSAAIADRLRNRYRHNLSDAQRRLEALRGPELDEAAQHQLVQLRALSDERQHLRRLFDNGHLDERPFRLLMTANGKFLDDLRHGHALPERRLRGRGPHPLAAAGLQLLRRLPVVGQRYQLGRIAGDYQAAWALYQVCFALLGNLDRVLPPEQYPEQPRQRAAQLYRGWLEEARSIMDHTSEQFPEFVAAMQERHAKRLALLAEVEVLQQRAACGAIDSGTAERLLHEKALELSRLRGLAADQLKVSPDELLRKVPLFADMSNDEFDVLARRMRERTCNAQETIIQQGESSDSLFMIARGVVRVTVEDETGTHEIATLIAGDFFGEMALLHRKPRTASVITVSPCTVYELRRSEFEKAAQTNPGITDAVAAVDAQRRAELADQRD